MGESIYLTIQLINPPTQDKMSAAAGSSPPPPPPGSNSNDKGTGHGSSSYPNLKIPLSGDGSTPQKAAWAGIMFQPPGITKNYVVDGVGLFPRYRRTRVEEAREYARLSYTILDGETYEVIPQSQIPPGPIGNPSMPPAAGIVAQMQEIVAHENALATGSGAATDAYNALQAHHGDAFVDDNVNTGNSSEDAAESSSDTSGDRSAGASSTD
ncbi:uncharacterized protein J4E78_009598 [Alternaria triticimaculans]|uniref:uncharacterized protein n=1 Tax=Alternaria triticimaculans TaxID=297637 RepID=UPI0020C4FF3C|nr:uncharacterized protein J4E78_009598 [Alternaria triticimaculans]KAI4644779.1 hypothetical protein J4E78_009598 [Alternaria triticimaculans]